MFFLSFMFVVQSFFFIIIFFTVSSQIFQENFPKPTNHA